MPNSSVKLRQIPVTLPLTTSRKTFSQSKYKKKNHWVFKLNESIENITKQNW